MKQYRYTSIFLTFFLFMLFGVGDKIMARTSWDNFDLFLTFITSILGSLVFYLYKHKQ